MKPLFLGLGKVNLALARCFSDEKVALVETPNGVEVLKAMGSSAFETADTIVGNFDSPDFPWKKFLPAQVFLSPGIDPRRSFFKQVSEWETRELDYFCKRFQGLTFGVTGTDGKSTFTLQLGELLKRVLPNRKIFVGGNLGIGMGEALKEKFDIAVLEISSFQAERLKTANLNFGFLLNLDIDHLDRYDDLKSYHQAKWNLLQHSKVIFYPKGLNSPEKERESAAAFRSTDSLLDILKVSMESLGRLLTFSWDEKYLIDLPTLPHRQKLFLDSQGRQFVDDSKATTVHAVLYALEIWQKKNASIDLILGGKEKGDDFTRLLKKLRPEDRVYIYGQASEKIKAALENGRFSIKFFPNLKVLLNEVIPQIKAQGCLLLSPGCASYDEFKNFEERGDYFY